MRFTGKIAIVTGGSRGIGRAVAGALCAEGASVAVLCSGRNKTPEDAARMAEEIGEGKGTVRVYFCDVSDYGAAQETVKQILSDFGTVDILVNNAGITRDKLMLAMKEEDFDRVLAVNLKGTFNMIRHCYGVFAKKRSGSIVNVASVSGMLGTAGQANYAASKAGIEALTKTVAHELGARGVRCNAVAPGYIETDMTAAISDSAKAAYLEQIPLGRYGKPEDVANTILFLASEDAAYITGQVLRVDGGMLMA